MVKANPPNSASKVKKSDSEFFNLTRDVTLLVLLRFTKRLRKYSSTRHLWVLPNIKRSFGVYNENKTIQTLVHIQENC